MCNDQVSPSVSANGLCTIHRINSDYFRKQNEPEVEDWMVSDGGAL
jgi:hypothetical protein